VKVTTHFFNKTVFLSAGHRRNWESCL